MKLDPTPRHIESESVELEKWKEERLAFLQNYHHLYDKLAINFQKDMIAKFASDTADAKEVREWLRIRQLVDYWPDDSFTELLTVLFLLVMGALSDTYRLWDLTPSVRKRDYLQKVRNAANVLADLLQGSDDQPVPPVPPLWYFLNDVEAQTLLTVIDRSRTDPESVNNQLFLDEIKRSRDSLPRAAAAIGECGVKAPTDKNHFTDDSRKYRWASYLYEGYGMPRRWRSYGYETDTPFLDADTAALIRRLGEYHAALPIDKDSTHDDEDRQIKMFAKKVFSILNSTFDVEERPYEPTAAIVRMHFRSRNERDEQDRGKAITDAWIEILARKL